MEGLVLNTALTVLSAIIFPFTAVMIVNRDVLPDIRRALTLRGKYTFMSYFILPVLVVALFLLSYDETFFGLFRKYILIFFGYIAAVSDFRFKIIPNGYVLSMIAVWVIVAVLQLATNFTSAKEYLIGALFGFLLGGGLFFAVYVISKGGLGGGDVKLMAVTGLYLTFNGILAAMFYGSVLSAVTGLTLIFLKKIGRKDAIPLVPFLYIGILITIFFFYGENV